MTKSSTPSASATRCSAPKITMSSSSGLITSQSTPGGAFARPGFATIGCRLMASTDSTLPVTARAPEGSRSARRLRREGLVPGVIYGGGDEPQHFAVDARTLRNTLAHAGQVIEVAVDGGTNDNVLIKDVQRHPVRGEPVHVDLLRVRMDVMIHATVPIEFTGHEEAPGVTEGGIFNQELREVNIEALPGDIPDSIAYDVSGLVMNETVTLSVLQAPAGVTLLDDVELVIATITPPTLEPVEEDIETETAIVGEDGAPVEAEGDEGESRRGGRAEGRLGRELKLFSSTPVDWLIVGLGNPGPGLRRQPAQRRLPRRRGAGRALGPAEAEEEVRRRARPRAAPARAARASPCCGRRPT